MKSEEQIKAEYYAINCPQTVDIGSVSLLRKEVNRKLEALGYAKLRGYKSRKQLFAINRQY